MTPLLVRRRAWVYAALMLLATALMFVDQCVRREHEPSPTSAGTMHSSSSPNR